MIEQVMKWLLCKNSKPKMTVSERKMSEWQRSSQEMLERLEDKRVKLNGMVAKLNRIVNSIKEDMERAEELEARHQVALEALKAELDVTEGTVKALEASHALILKRIDADIATQTRREVAFSTREE